MLFTFSLFELFTLIVLTFFTGLVASVLVGERS